MKVPFQLEAILKSFILKFSLFLFLSCSLSHAQSRFRLMESNPLSPVSILTASPTESNPALSSKEEKCLHAGQWIGLITGAGLGILHTYWSIKYTPDKSLPMWKYFAAGVPATLISSYVGSKAMRWATKRIIAGHPKPVVAVFKGAFYGALAGTVILASNYLPFFLSSYYLGTIRFNNLGKHNRVLKLVGITFLGSAAYGGTVGAIIGAAYGPCISFYLHF